MGASVFTIGHSTHALDDFIRLLALHSIEAVADVRSSPFSRRNPQFNQRNLQQGLQSADIRYVYLGKELGARSDDPTCYENGQVQYMRLAKTALFQSGIERVIEGVSKYRIALMCAEKEPLHCHRTILVSRELARRSIGVVHILADGVLEAHTDTVARLVTELRLSADDMFLSRAEIEDSAYALQAEKRAYTRP